MKNQKEKSVSFTGYRSSKIILSSPDPDIIGIVGERVYQTIISLYAHGYIYYYNGMSEGFDLIAALAVLKLKELHPEVQLIAVIPFEGQELKYSDKDKITYKHICNSANQVLFTSSNHEKDVYLKRNDYLLDSCKVVVCYYNGVRGGTMYTYNRALKRGLQIINIFDSCSSIL